MVAQIIWSFEAQKDVDNLAAYIAQDSPAYAANVVTKILEAVKDLPQHPFIGRRVPEWEDDTIREVFVYNYRIIYQVPDHTIQILAIIHGKRLLEPILETRKPKPS